MKQLALIPDERKPCTACKGTGRRFNEDLGWRDEQPCYRCGGSGLEGDRIDPELTDVPY